MKKSAHQTLYERLAREFHAGVYSYLRWLSQDADTAQDLTQETFLQVWRHPPEVRSAPELRAWVFTVARNQYLQHRRRRGLQTTTLESREAEGIADGEHADVQVHLERSELARVIRGALEALPDIYREVIALHNLEGLSLDEVAAVLGIPTGTVKSRRSKAFEMLRHMLAGEVTCYDLP